MFKYHEDEVPMTDLEPPDDDESLARESPPSPVVKRRPKHLMNQSPGNSTFEDYMSDLDSEPDIEGADAKLKATKSTPAVVKPFIKPSICTPLPKVAPKMKSTPGFLAKATANSNSDCDSLEEPSENIDDTKSKPGKATPAVKKPLVATPAAALPVQRKATPAMPKLKRPLVAKVHRKGTPAFAAVSDLCAKSNLKSKATPNKNVKSACCFGLKTAL